MSEVSQASARFQDFQVARRMLRERGLWATVVHARSIALLRLHRWFIDGPLQRELPHPVIRQRPVGGMNLRTVNAVEAEAWVPLSTVPCKTFDWAMAGLQIDPSGYHFIDIGSGVGHALMLAGRYPFRALTGVEFARELTEQARANVACLRAAGRIRNVPVDLRHESALETELPDGPCLVFMFCPFDERVMKKFIARIEYMLKTKPRPLLVVYVNPSHASLFVRPGITELALNTPARWLLRLFSSYQVRAFTFGVETGVSSR